MKTKELTAVNLSDPNCLEEATFLLGKAPTSVISMIKKNNLQAFCYVPFNKWLFEKYFKPFSAENTDYVYDYDAKLLFVRGRDKYARSFRTRVFNLEIIGYKLPTTHIQGGYIYGNPTLIYDLPIS